MSRELFDHHIRELMADRLDQLCNERQQQVRDCVQRVEAEESAKRREWHEEQRRRSDVSMAAAQARHTAELQASALARRSVTGSVVVSATATVRTELSREYLRFWHSYREDCIPKHVRERNASNTD